MKHEDFENLAALHAIDALSPVEKESLRQHLESCPDCAGAAAEYRDASTLIATSIDPVQPPPAARDRIRNAVVGDRADEVTIRDSTMTQRARRPAWWLAAAAVVFLALWGWTEMRLIALRAQFDELRAAKQGLEESNRRLQQDRGTLSATMRALTASQTRTIALAGQQVAPSASARVFLDSQNRRAFIFFHQLPPNPGDKSYQLWIIRADSPKPQPAGVFNVDERGEAQLSVENLPVGKEFKALAVTLEPRGGVAAPTGKMYLVGG